MFESCVVVVARWAYRLLARFIPRQPNKISLVSYPDYTDNAKAISDYFLQQGGWKVVWLTADASISANSDAKFVSVKKNTLRGLYEFLSSAVVFYTHGTYFFAARGGPLQINLWHGMPIKNIGLLDGKRPSELFYCDYSIATSPYFQEKIASAFGLDKDRVWPTGLPRNDYLLKSNEQSKSLLFRGLDLSPDHSYVFWMPTFRTSNHGDTRSDSQYATFLDEWPDTFLGDLNGVASAANTYVLIKLHPMDTLNAQAIDVSYSHVRIIRSSEWLALGVDLYSALGGSSALISDVSSVLIDYLITNKPIAITAPSVTGYQRGLMNDVTLLMSALPRLSSAQEFLAFVANPNAHTADGHALEAFYSDSLCDQGATKRVVERVERCLSGRSSGMGRH